MIKTFIWRRITHSVAILFSSPPLHAFKIKAISHLKSVNIPGTGSRLYWICSKHSNMASMEVVLIEIHQIKQKRSNKRKRCDVSAELKPLSQSAPYLCS